MHDESVDRGSRGRLIASMAGALLFVYVAATGPISAYFENHPVDDDAPLMKSMQVVYYPVIKLADACGPVSDALEWYGQLCSKVMYGREWGR